MSTHFQRMDFDIKEFFICQFYYTQPVGTSLYNSVGKTKSYPSDIPSMIGIMFAFSLNFQALFAGFFFL